MQELTPYLSIIGPPTGAALAAFAAWLKTKPSKSQMDRIEANILYLMNNGTEGRRQMNQNSQDISDLRDALQGHAETRDAHSNRFTRRRARSQLVARATRPEGLPAHRPPPTPDHAPA